MSSIQVRPFLFEYGLVSELVLTSLSEIGELGSKIYRIRSRKKYTVLKKYTVFREIYTVAPYEP